jgi:hypothetical protein
LVWSLVIPYYRPEHDLLCSECGKTEGHPFYAGYLCDDLACTGKFEAIDPEILRALLPFAPEKPPENDNGNIWLYNRTITLPSTSSFNVVMSFGDSKKTEFTATSADKTFKITLLNHYTNTVEIS